MSTLSDLVSSKTKTEVLDQIVALLRLGNFPTASWLPFSLGRHLFETLASYLADQTSLVAALAKGGFLDDAEGAWLTLLAKSLFNEDRKAAVATRGKVRLTDATGTGPYAVTAGQWWVRNTSRTRTWKVIAAATIPAGSYVDVDVEAESPGAAWNAPVGTITELVAPGGTGVTVSNPALDTGTWITTQGADEESDTDLRQRCRDKWSTVGSGSDEGAFRYWATSSSSEITRVKVAASTTDGSVAVTIAGPSGPVSSDALTLARATVDAKRPLCCAASVDHAVTQTESVAGTLYLNAGANADETLAAVKAAIDAYASGLDIGGTVVRSRLIAAAHSVSGVRSFALTSPGADLALAGTAIFVPSYALVTAT